MRKFLGEMLVEEGLITNTQLNQALTLKSREYYCSRLGKILTDLGLISSDTLTEYIAKQHGVPGINLQNLEIDRKVIELLPQKVADNYQAIPVGFKQRQNSLKLLLATNNPSNLDMIDNICFLTGYEIETVYAREEDLKYAIRYYYHYSKTIPLS